MHGATMATGMTQRPSESELALAIAGAARSAFSDLFAKHSGEHFYYCSLIVSGSAVSPILSAWSREALQRALQESSLDEEELKWSYADSPYRGFGEEYFDEVTSLFAARPQPIYDPEAWPAENALRLRAMEAAMARLDHEGLFGSGPRRLSIVINAEVMPPDNSNVERALRLNPRAALAEWLREAAED